MLRFSEPSTGTSTSLRASSYTQSAFPGIDPSSAYVFVRQDDQWLVRYDGIEAIYEDRFPLGMGCIATLLGKPRTAFPLGRLHMLVTVPRLKRRPGILARILQADHLPEPEFVDSLFSLFESRQDVFDEIALAKLSERLDDYNDAIAAAEEAGNDGLVKLLREERDRLWSFVKEGVKQKEYTRGGKLTSRELRADRTHRRESISHAIRRAYEHLAADEALASALVPFLRKHIKTAHGCLYAPPFGHPGWLV